jgi:hypothetical protein
VRAPTMATCTAGWASTQATASSTDRGAAPGGEPAQRRDDLQVAGEPSPGEGRAVRPPVVGAEGGGFGDSAAEQARPVWPPAYSRPRALPGPADHQQRSLRRAVGCLLDDDAGEFVA